MFHDARLQLPSHDFRHQHLRHRLLLKHAILLTLDRQVYIYATALRRRDLHAETVFAQEDLTRVGRVELDGGSVAGDLQGEGGGVGDGDRGDHRLNEDGGFRAVCCRRKMSVWFTCPTIENLPIVTALTLPLITMVARLQPYKLTVWFISTFSTSSLETSSWYSCIGWMYIKHWLVNDDSGNLDLQ